MLKDTWADKLIARLHERAGLCIHCGKKLCVHARGTTLPDQLPTGLVLELISAVHEEEKK